MEVVPRFPKFKGKFKTFSLALNTNRETGLEQRLRVFSQGSRATVFEYLWLTWLGGTLSDSEFELFLVLPETLNNEMIYNAIKASYSVDKRHIRERLITFPFRNPKDTPSYQKYQGIRKSIVVETYKFSRSLPKVPKFSGWIKSSSQVGSKRPSGSSFLEPPTLHWIDYTVTKFDWYFYLTVGGSALTR